MDVNCHVNTEGADVGSHNKGNWAKKPVNRIFRCLDLSDARRGKATLTPGRGDVPA